MPNEFDDWAVGILRQVAKQLIDDIFKTEEPMSNMTVEQLDNLVKEMRDARDDYEKISKLKEQAYAVYTEADNKLMNALEQMGKKAYRLDGYGTYSIVSRMRVTTPKTIEEKRALMQYITSKYGSDVAVDKISINHNTLNSFYKEEYEACPDDKKATFQIPGLESPVEENYSKWISERPKKV